MLSFRTFSIARHLLAPSLPAASYFLSTSSVVQVKGGVEAMHIKPSRFPRNTNRKKKFGQYYTPKPGSPWYKLVEAALSHPSMHVQADATAAAEAPDLADVTNAHQLLAEEEQRLALEREELRAKTESRKKRREERAHRKHEHKDEQKAEE
jgi:hypothetical protein